jgi:hypothetical protein
MNPGRIVIVIAAVVAVAAAVGFVLVAIVKI